MYKFLSFLLAFTLAVSLSGIPAEAASVSDISDAASDTETTLAKGTFEEGQVLVTLAAPDNTALTDEGTVSFDSHMTVEDSWDFGDARVLGKTTAQKDYLEDKTLYVTKISSDKYSTKELLKELDHQAYVVTVEPDYYQEKMAISNDTLYDSQWYLDGTGSFNTASSGIRYSHYKQSSGSDIPVAAVVDTGIDYTHEDLADHMWNNPYAALPGTYGYDFGDMDSDPMDEDSEGHGTHCAGVIGAVSNNQKGITGIAGSVRLMALKVFNSSGKATNSAITGAFNYIYQAQKLGVNITAVNCSWGGGSSTDTMKTLISKIGQSGALFIFASGNSGVNQDASITKQCPYDMNSPYTVVAGASDNQDQKADYSDYGASSVDLFAPGSQILSTINSNIFFPAIYPETARNSMCSYYSSCDSTDIPLSTLEETGRSAADSICQGLEHSAIDYFGDKAGGSLCAHINSSRTSDTLALYLDVTSLNLNTQSSYYIAYDMGLNDGDGFSWEHCYSKRDSNAFVSHDGRTYLRLINLTGSFRGISRIYFDNLSVSLANPNTGTFGKYNIYSGTSMAAPSVTAAVAVLSSAYPKDTAPQRRERLLNCVRKANGVSGYCQTGGILDLSKVSTATIRTTSSSQTSSTKKNTKVAVKKVKLNKKKATLRYKKKLKLKATITPKNATNKKVKWYSSKKKYATVTQSGVVKAKKKGIGHTVKIYAKAKDGSGKKAYCKVTIKKKKK